MSSQIPGGEWYQKCSKLEAQLAEARQAADEYKALLARAQKERDAHNGTWKCHEEISALRAKLDSALAELRSLHTGYCSRQCEGPEDVPINSSEMQHTERCKRIRFLLAGRQPVPDTPFSCPTCKDKRVVFMIDRGNAPCPACAEGEGDK